jgi:hypothetical protein
MRLIIRLLVAALMLAAAPLLSVTQQPMPQKHVNTKAHTVYITRTGKRYHRKGCQQLRGGKIAMGTVRSRLNIQAAVAPAPARTFL